MEQALAQSQRLQSIGTLTGGIAHDFNNLNTVVIGNLDLLALARSEEEKAEYVDEALKAARRGAKLTQSLLSFGRQAMLKPDRIDLRSRLTELASLLDSTIKETTQVEFINDGPPLEVHVDQTNLESAILNLVVNADHALGDKPGKISVELTTSAETQEDLALAYSPGVAEPCREIARDHDEAYRYTGKGNLVAVISNGTAVLGLGNIGAMASKPVMEGKALLFKRFAGVDSIDIEVDTEDPQHFIDTVVRIADTFGGINLEDIKAPECFHIEKVLIEQCRIPVFHDDQHGTAIVTAAGMKNALEIQGKTLEEAKIVCLGAGSAAIACMRLLKNLGAQQENLTMIDRGGVIYTGREGLNEYKEEFAHMTDARSMEEALDGADVFLGLSGANLLAPELLKKMAPKPIVFACSNPDPEIAPDLAKSVRDDLIMATGRSDFPNQVNNVLGFPFIFRGALDVRARRINEEMKVAAVNALCEVAKLPVPQEVLDARGEEKLEFGPDYIIPKPMDSRLLGAVSAAVAKAAVDTGVATLPYPSNYPLSSVDEI